MNYREFYFKNTNTLSRFINLIRISEIDYEIQKTNFPPLCIRTLSQNFCS